MDNAAYFFKSLNDQAEVLDMLRSMLHNFKIPNALAFTGNQGSGRKDAGLLFAAAINCTDRCNEKPGAQKKHFSITSIWRYRQGTAFLAEKSFQVSILIFLWFHLKRNSLKYIKLELFTHPLQQDPMRQKCAW